MGGDLPVGGVSGGTGTAKAGAPPSPGGGLLDRRARVASRALRPSSSRCASVTAGPVGLGGARGDVTGSHFSTNRAAGRHAEQQHRRDSCRRERLRLPSYTAGQTLTVHRLPKTSHSGPTRDHSVSVGYCLFLIPSRQILPSHLARLSSVLLPTAP